MVQTPDPCFDSSQSFFIWVCALHQIQPEKRMEKGQKYGKIGPLNFIFRVTHQSLDLLACLDQSVNKFKWPEEASPPNHSTSPPCRGFRPVPFPKTSPATQISSVSRPAR